MKQPNQEEAFATYGGLVRYYIHPVAVYFNRATGTQSTLYSVS